MRVQNCFHPKVIKNPYSGEVNVCRCGKCPACTNTRASQWVMRLDLESQCHKYVLFTTLTYDDYKVPQIVRCRFEDYPYKGYAYINGETGQLFETRDIKEHFEPRDWQYIRDSKVVNFLDKSDFQKFIKRLRYYFNQTDKGATLRYFICGEYGPRTYRPHGHMLLFFDSEKCSDKILELLSKSWRYGNVYDPHFVSGSASEYCASYINSLSKLPKLYHHKWLRPFTLFSKSPAIGTLHSVFSNMFESWVREDVTFRRFDKTSLSFRDEFLPRAVESRLYPRFQRFGSLFSTDRVALLRAFEEDFAKYPWLTAVDIANRIKREYLDKRNDTFLCRYFYEISHKRKFGLHFEKHDIPTDFSSLPFAPFEPKEIGFVSERTEIREFCFDSLVRFVRVLCRIREQSRIFGVTMYDYLKKIESYYDKKSHFKLRLDYESQDVYFASHPKWHIIYFDKSFYDLVTKKSLFSLTRYTCRFLNFLYDGNPPLKWLDGSLWLDIPSLDDLPEFQDFKVLHLKISHDLVKQKENNDYAFQRKDKFKNVINYQNI